jgi:hypothetical protein
MIVREFIACLFFLFACTGALSHPLEPGDVLRAFLDAELSGAMGARYDFAAFSAEPKHPDDHVVDHDSSRLRIVENFTIESISSDADGITALVRFLQIAKTAGVGIDKRRIVASHREDWVRYSMVRENGVWKILDPPPPRVSATAVERSLVGHRDAMQEISKLRQLSVSQAAYLGFVEQNLSDLRVILSRSEAKGENAARRSTNDSAAERRDQ